MKPVGTKFEFAEQRNEDLISTYRRKMSECEVIRLPKVLRETVQSPSKRFWVSEERAIIVVMQMMAGNNLDRMQPMRKAMYEEIYRRTMKMKMMNPEMTFTEIVSLVIEQPAPCFYLTPGSAKVIIHKAMKKRK
ncbi:MAG: hypothetical protein IKJ09_00640 [Bacteroidaceae bacterium]|nr:hypothetical protein [Bacteroidaceae bacterium]